MLSHNCFKKILAILAWLLIAISAVWIIFEFLENGLRLLGATQFWTVMNSLWLLAILLFLVETKIK